MVIAVLFYNDFFQYTPPSTAVVNTKSTSRTTQVRFHDQARIKKIKPTGKNKPLYEDDSEDDSEDDEENEAQVNVDQMECDDEDEEMEENEEEDEEEDEEDFKPATRQAIERLKHDLFAEEEEEVQDGKCPQIVCL